MPVGVNEAGFSDLLQRLFRVLHAHVWRYSAREGISLAEYQVLSLLRSGLPLTMHEIKNSLFSTGALATSVADKLVDNKLAVRKRTTRDRRQVTLMLTGKGKQRLAGLDKNRDRMFADFFADLSSGDKITMEKGVGVLVASLENLKRSCLLGMIVFFICGCSSVRHVVPQDLLCSATVFGMQDVRAFSGSPSDAFKNDFERLLALEEDGREPYSMLAISGGGANGAYGAGLLTGWSQAGTRPEFKVITGISTGAIMAPLAFLGSRYDERLKEFYTRYSTKDIVRLRIPFTNSFANTRPLERLIKRYFDKQLLDEIAAEHAKGRRLYVGTTNLDAQRLVIWDMGKIAAAGDAQALVLFRKIILASSSMPIAFPPVYFHVQANDKKYDEMHVDGGISKQVFFLYDVLQGFDRALKEKYQGIPLGMYKIYVIRNGYVDPQYAVVPDKLLAIAARSVDTMINAQSVGDLYQLYTFAQNGRGDFNLAHIPATHASKAREVFDLVEMKSLFDLGFAEASQGYPWRKTPPGIEFPEE